MLLDTNQQFQDICTDEDFKHALHDLKVVLKSRDQPQVWARHLRFICPAPGYEKPHLDIDDSTENSDEECVCYSGWTFEANEGENKLMVTNQGAFPDCSHYVAVSWCWTFAGEPKAAPTAPKGYFIQDTTRGIERRCTIPKNILSRAIAFASFYKVPFLWFDKECINQQDPADQELGIQSMDIVYQRSLYPLGLLQSYLDKQWHLDMFNLMVEGLPITADQMPQLLELLTIIEQDKYFTRAWILQASVCGGDKMTLLIQHDPSLNKTAVLGPLPGEIEITLEEFKYMLSWIYTCIALCDSPIDSDIETSLRKTVDNILDFFPSVLMPPEGGFESPDYRQTCNAAQALTYLNSKQNTIVGDRIAILGNLCDYRLCLDTNELEKRGYGFSLCAYALAIFNGDLSLSRLDNPCSTNGAAQCFSWGPQPTLRMNHLQYFEGNADEVVRISPARLMNEGLLTKGWLWQIDEVATLNLNINSNPAHFDLTATIWSSLKLLVRGGYYELAEVLWKFTRRFSLDRHPASSKPRGDSDLNPIPEKLEDILQKHTATFIYHNEPWIKSEDDFRVLFEDINHGNDNRMTTFFEGRARRWPRLEWFWRYLLENANLPIANLCNNHNPQGTRIYNPAVFLPQLCPQIEDGGHHTVEIPVGSYVFLPSTCLDQKPIHGQRESRAIYWRVQVEINPDFDHCVVRGTGEMLYGFCRPPENCEPETFIFA